MAAPISQEMLGGTIWKLQCYARFQTKDVQSNVEEGRSQQNVSGKWKYIYPSEKGSLMLSLQEECQLVISNGPTILESCFLRNASQSLKAFTKTDSILFVQIIKNETRRFRVKFLPTQNLTSDEYCAVCVKRLSTVLMIKPVAADDKVGNSRKQLSGEVSVGEIAKVVTHSLPADLPAAYHHDNTQATSDQLRTLVRLCLTDPTFPAFVDEVETELKALSFET